MGVIPKEKKREVIIEIGKILDRHCNECDMYLENIHNRGKKYAIKYCHMKCQIGKKMHKLAESISPNNRSEGDEIDEYEDEKIYKQMHKYDHGYITKEFIIDKLNKGLNHEEISELINRSRQTITYYVKKYGIKRIKREDGKIYYE